MTTDRNALEDLFRLLALLEITTGEGLALEERAEWSEIGNYWFGQQERQPWGACALVERDGLFLAILGDKGLGLPGGKPLANETPVACALRELTEETGIAADEWDVLPSMLADNHVLTHAIYVNGRYWGKLEESPEGLPMWIEPHLLWTSPRARFPKYNKKIIELAEERR